MNKDVFDFSISNADVGIRALVKVLLAKSFSYIASISSVFKLINYFLETVAPLYGTSLAL